MTKKDKIMTVHPNYDVHHFYVITKSKLWHTSFLWDYKVKIMAQIEIRKSAQIEIRKSHLDGHYEMKILSCHNWYFLSQLWLYLIQPFVFLIHNCDFLSHKTFNVMILCHNYDMNYERQFVQHKKKCFGKLWNKNDEILSHNYGRRIWEYFSIMSCVWVLWINHYSESVIVTQPV